MRGNKPIRELHKIECWAPWVCWGFSFQSIRAPITQAFFQRFNGAMPEDCIMFAVNERQPVIPALF